MPRGNGGIIGPANIPTQSSAKGVWSLSELTLAVRQSIWPLENLSADPYFEYTTLLLPGNGTNGAQNNTFLDGSTNNFTITRNGNTTQGTFSPFSQTGWGNYFDGSGDYLTAPNNAAFGFGASDFTIEAWIFPTAFSNFNSVFCVNVSGGLFFGATNGTTSFGLRAAGVSDILTATSPSLNTWTHVAVTRSGVNVYLFYNGVQQATTTSSYSFAQSSIGIGSDGGNSSLFTGYISNLRVIKGQALYTSAFTPSTTSLTTTSQGATAGNVSLLTCQSNRFIDNSTNNFTITPNGNTSVVAFSPFNPTASWSAATYGGSGYFDGNGDYLELTNNSAFDMSTGNFTAEFYVYTQDQTNSYPGILANSTYNATGAVNIRYDNTGNANKFFVYLFGASPADPAITSGTYGFNQWMHVALVRDSSTSLKLYINGVLDGSQTISSGQTISFGSTASTFLRIGRGFDVDGANGYCAGNVSNVRIVKGQSLASGNFTPPSAPVTASAVGWTGANAAGSLTGTVSLLLNFTNAGIYDATSKNNLETVGNAQLSNAVTPKWGSTSIKFDGTGDWLLIPDQPPQRIGTGNFTVEMWVYRNSSGTYGLAGKGTGTTGWLVSLNSSNQVVFTYGSSTITSSGTVSATTWTHIAVVREGTSTNQTKIYISGTNDGTGTVSTDFNQTNSMYIGADRTGGSAANAYVQDVRITNYARYTANFTPPTAPFQTF